MDLWVVGAGGLLGSALVRNRPADARVFRPGPVPWYDPALATAFLRTAVADFRDRRRGSVPWCVVWAAGTGVVASDAAELSAQEAVMLSTAEQVAGTLDPHGAFVFASSASVFGDAPRQLDETDPAAPVSPYAAAKLRQEDALAATFRGRGAGLGIARISTLYGVGQNLTKRQGLVSSMCLQAVRGGVITLYVPVDTTRDYLLADDAAPLLWALHRRTLDRAEPGPVVRVLASHRTTTVGELARVVQAVAHRRVHVVQAAVPGSGHQRHQAVRSLDPSLTAVPRTPLVVGVDRVHRDVLARTVAAGALPV